MHPNSELRSAIQLQPLAESAVKPEQAENRSALSQAADEVSTGRPAISTPSEASSKQILKTAALVAAVAVAGWLVTTTAIDETAYDDWAHVNAAANASLDPASSALIHRDADGAMAAIPVIQVRAADLDAELSTSVRKALIRNDLARANQLLGERFSTDSNGSQNPPADLQTPNLDTTPDLVIPLKDGRMNFFHLHMRDCCHEDGDVVQIDVNGQPYTVVPLTHAGATISVPLSSGITTLTLRGIKDGRGGITIQFSTSRGDYFARAMEVGEEYHIGVAAP